ncbi:MAG: citrate synthase [Rubrivivax sp.]|jgi:citrate synthase
MSLKTPRSTGVWLSAEEAAQALGVRKATLYAYASRGLLTALPDPQDPQRSRYAQDEIDRLRDGPRRGRAREAQAVHNALYEGWPLVDTALTGVVDGQLVHRGQPVVAWSQQHSLEATAALLWQVPEAAAFGPAAPRLPALWHRTARALADTEPVARAVTLWGLAMPGLEGGADLGGDALAAALGRHLRVAAACWWAQAPSAEPLHAQLAQAWQLGPAQHDSLRQALVLCADMVPNLMGLSARMMASLQGSLAACLLSSMAYGFVRLSGGEFEAVQALFDEVQANGSLARVAAAYRARGEALPGVNHHLFVQGDPRAAALLLLATRAGSPVGAWLAEAAGDTPLHATIDFALVALCRALGAPRHGALVLMHLARSTGMLAQALEQRAQGRRMWVQSRYVGPGLAAVAGLPAAVPAGRGRRR